MQQTWERVLWKPQPYSDNYVPPLFLVDLQRNPNFKPYTFPQLVVNALAITQHLATTFIFVSVFVRLHLQILDPRILVWASIALFVTAFAVWVCLDKNLQPAKVIKSAVLVFVALVSLSPILRTLTAATSSDSIWALSAFLLALNALLADYSYVSHGRLTSVLSMNAAISASVVLASRLSSDLAVFALILFSVQAFALFPILRRRIQSTALTVPLVILSIGLMWPLSQMIATLFGAVLLFITLLAPAALVWSQQFKNEIRGPWDVAIPKID